MDPSKQIATSSAFEAAAKAALKDPSKPELARTALKLVSRGAPFALLLELTKLLYPSPEFPTWSSFCEENPGVTLEQGVGKHLHEAPDEICALLYDELFFCAASDPPADCTGVIYQSGRPIFEGDEKILYKAGDTLEARKALIFRFAGCSQHEFYGESLVDNSRGQSIFHKLFGDKLFGEDFDVDEVADSFCITTAQAKKILLNSLKEGGLRACIIFCDLMFRATYPLRVAETYDKLTAGTMLYSEAVEAVKDEPQKAKLAEIFAWGPDVERRRRPSWLGGSRKRLRADFYVGIVQTSLRMRARLLDGPEGRPPSS